jgi:hypothetical protein
MVVIKFDTSRDTLNSFMMFVVADDGADDAKDLRTISFIKSKQRN